MESRLLAVADAVIDSCKATCSQENAQVAAIEVMYLHTSFLAGRDRADPSFYVLFGGVRLVPVTRPAVHLVAPVWDVVNQAGELTEVGVRAQRNDG